MEVYRCTAPPNLMLLKVESSLYLSDVQTYAKFNLFQLISIKENWKWLILAKFNKLKSSVDEEILSLTPTARLQNSDTFDWQTLKSETFCELTERLIKEIKRHLSNFNFG